MDNRTDQEIINQYLKNNPLNKRDKAKGLWLPRCVACDGSVNHSKKKPVTTFSGTMNSVFTDHVDSFPRHEQEDLCVRCQEKIKYQNSDKNNQYNAADYYGVKNYTCSLDSDQLEVENSYQGFSSFEMLEGTSYTLGSKDGEI